MMRCRVEIRRHCLPDTEWIRYAIRNNRGLKLSNTYPLLILTLDKYKVVQILNLPNYRFHSYLVGCSPGEHGETGDTEPTMFSSLGVLSTFILKLFL